MKSRSSASESWSGARSGCGGGRGRGGLRDKHTIAWDLSHPRSQLVGLPRYDLCHRASVVQRKRTVSYAACSSGGKCPWCDRFPRCQQIIDLVKACVRRSTHALKECMHARHTTCSHCARPHAILMHNSCTADHRFQPVYPLGHEFSSAMPGRTALKRGCPPRAINIFHNTACHSCADAGQKLNKRININTYVLCHF